MLQNIGDKLKSQRWLATIVLGLLALIFAIWGAYGIVNISFGAPDYGLKVNGERISTDTLNRAWQEKQSQAQQALKGGDLSDVEKQLLQQQVLDEYTRQAVLRQRAQSAGYRVSDADVLAAYRSEPAFQIDGQFNPTVAQAMLTQAGMTPETFEADRRQSLQVTQLTEGVQISDFLTPAELQRIYALENEQREIRFATLPVDRYAAAVKIDDAKIKAWYDAHQADYQTSESVHLKYAQLKLDAIEAEITVKPEDLQAYYQKNLSRYGEVEKRHAHHILITVADPKDAKADAAALAKAQSILAELKSGKDFAELAKKYSADPGSATQGGDLGWAEKSAYVGSFGDALFAMKAGQLSDPVKTQYGYHIIRLDEVQPAHVKTLEEAHAQIESEYRRDQASELFGDRQEQLQQKMDSGDANSLDSLAKQFNLQTGEIADFTRSAGGEPLGAKPDVIAAVFSPDAISGAKLGGPVAVADDQLVIFKVLEHHAPAAKPLASVHDEIVAAIRKSEGTAAAKAAADDAVKQLEGGAAFDSVIKSLNVTAAPATFYGRSDPQLPVQVRETAFAAAVPKGKSVNRDLALENGGAAIVSISAVKVGASGANPKADDQLFSEYEKRDREGDMTAYLDELQNRAEIKRNPTIFQ